MIKFAIFDFDKTIVSKDTGAEFVKFLLALSTIRTISGKLLLPLVYILCVSPYSKLVSIGLSIYCWLATVGLTGKDFKQLEQTFLLNVFSSGNVKVYQDAIDKMKEHQSLGHKVIVISGSPKSLIEGIFRQINIDNIKIIASQGQRFLGGFVPKEHCYMEKKAMILRRELGDISGESWCYTDSRLDIPILALCKNKFLVNPSKKSLKECVNAFGKQISIVNWA